MDDNARSHRAAIVDYYRRQEAIDVLPWASLSPDMNPLEHVLDQIKCELEQQTPPPVPEFERVACCSCSGVEFIPPEKAAKTCSRNERSSERTFTETR